MLAKKALNSQRTAIDVWGFRRCDALPSCLALREPMQSGKRSFRCLFAARFFSVYFQRMLLGKCYTSIYNHITCIHSNNKEIKIIGCRSQIHREKALQQQVLKLEAVSSHVSDQSCI